MSTDDNKPVVPVSDGTQQVEPVESVPQDNAEHAEEPNVESPNNSDAETPPSDGSDDVDYKEKYERIKTKQSKRDKEFNAMGRKLQDLEQSAPRIISPEEVKRIDDRIVSLSKTDPVRAKAEFDAFKSSGNWLEPKTGSPLGEFEKYYGTPKTENVSVPAPSIEDVRREAYNAAAEQATVDKFFEKHPQFDARKASQEDTDGIALRYAYIRQLAANDMAYDVANKKNPDLLKSLELAVSMADPKTVRENAFEDGKLAGKHAAYVDGMSQTQVVSSGAGKTAPSVELTPEDKAIAKMAGVSEEDMLAETVDDQNRPRLA